MVSHSMLPWVISISWVQLSPSFTIRCPSLAFMNPSFVWVTTSIRSARLMPWNKVNCVSWS